MHLLHNSGFVMNAAAYHLGLNEPPSHSQDADICPLKNEFFLKF